MAIRVFSIVQESVVDGPGIRCAVFLQGCAHNCPGCHNPESHDFSGGHPVEEDDLYKEITKNPLCKGITFTGGDPIYQWHAIANIVKRLKGEGYRLMLYTGFSFANMLLFAIDSWIREIRKIDQGDDICQYSMDADRVPGRVVDFFDLLTSFEYLVTDPFIEEQKSAELWFRGSKNQKVYASMAELIDESDPTIRRYVFREVSEILDHPQTEVL